MVNPFQLRSRSCANVTAWPLLVLKTFHPVLRQHGSQVDQDLQIIGFKPIVKHVLPLSVSQNISTQASSRLQWPRLHSNDPAACIHHNHRHTLLHCASQGRATNQSKPAHPFTARMTMTNVADSETNDLVGLSVPCSDTPTQTQANAPGRNS